MKRKAMAPHKKRLIYQLLVTIVLALAGGFIVISDSQHDKFQNDRICYTASIPIKGIISGMGGHGSYQWITVNNIKKDLDIGVSDIKLTKGFTDDYVDYRVGDSVIKRANSNEFVIKRGKDFAVYILSCED